MAAEKFVSRENWKTLVWAALAAGFGFGVAGEIASGNIFGAAMSFGGFIGTLFLAENTYHTGRLRPYVEPTVAPKKA